MTQSCIEEMQKKSSVSLLSIFLEEHIGSCYFGQMIDLQYCFNVTV